MSFKIVPLSSFKRDFKKLLKKYKNIIADFKVLTLDLQENPKAGIYLQNNCYKIRVANSSIPIGKSGGFRTIYYYIDESNEIYLISIYSKTQKDTINKNKIAELLKINGLI